jgi:hypothetical protein
MITIEGEKAMKQTVMELKYALYLIRHPFKGFWEIKHEKEGSLKTAVILIAAVILVQILTKLFSGYLFGGMKNAHYNLLHTIISFMAVFMSWCIANWCLTCLSDGKGTFKDILIATAYALVPFVIIQLPMIAVSNYFILREEVFYHILNGLSLFWTGLLIVVSQIVTHQFTLTRTVVVILFTIVGMLTIACLLLLFFHLIQQVVVFVSIVAEELILRLSY